MILMVFFCNTKRGCEEAKFDKYCPKLLDYITGG